MILKISVFLVIFYAVAGKKTMEEAAEKCTKNSGFSQKEVSKILSEGLRSVEDFMHYKCFFKCVLQKMKMIDSDGNIKPKNTEELDSDFQSCADGLSRLTDVCGKAYGIFSCLQSSLEAQKNPDMPRDIVPSKCYDELGSDIDVWFKFIITGDFKGTNNQKLKCFYKCAYSEWEWMTDDGDFVKDKVYEGMWIKTESEKESVAHCFNATGGDSCQKAFDLAKCLDDVYDD